MPPKPNKGKKKKKQSNISIDDVDTAILNRQQLEEFCITVNNELNKEKQYSETLRLERDKLVNMIAISRDQLKMLKNTNRQIENDIRDAEDGHRVEMAFETQKMIHFKNELESKCFGQKLYTKKMISDEQKSQKEVTAEIIADINLLKARILQVENDFIKNKVETEKEHAKNIHKIQIENDSIKTLNETRGDKKLNEISYEVRIRSAIDYKILENLKAKEYQRLLDENSKRTIQLKHYYKRIGNHNLEVIQQLKNKMQEIKETMGKQDMQYFQTKEENQKLVQELGRLDQEKSILKEKLFSSEEHKNKLKETKEKLLKNRKILLNLKVEFDVLDMIHEKEATIEKKESETLTTTLFKSCSKAQKIILVIEFYVAHMYNALNETNAYLCKIKGVYEKEGKWNKLLGSIDKNYDTSLDLINYEIAQIAEERNDLFQKYRKVLNKFNIPFENTGFVPIHFKDILAKIDNNHMLVNEESMLPLRIPDEQLLRLKH